MLIYLCGKGAGCEAVLRQMVADRHKVYLFTHPGPTVNVARDLGVPYSLRSVNEFDAWPHVLPPALLVSVGYLHIVTPAVLAAVPAINCHYALLPNHRGRSAVPWAILDGDTVAGITWHWMTPKVDRGRIILQSTCQVARDETAASLFDKLHGMVADYWPGAFHLAAGRWPGVAQAEGGQYHRAGPPHDGEIDPRWDDDYTERYIRAMTFPPLPYARLCGEEVRNWDEFEAVRDRMLRGYAV